MSRHYSLKPRKFAMELRTSESCSVHGGQLAIVGLIRQSGLMGWVSDYPQLEHRKNRNRGFDPEVYISTFLYNFCTGGWQTLWTGPLILECELGGQRGVSECFGRFCTNSEQLRKKGKHYLYADSGSSDGEDLEHAAEHFTRHSISYNKWTSPLERMAGGLPEEGWGESGLTRWRGGTRHPVSYSWVRHQPSGCKQAHNFAALRHKREGDMFWSYCFIEVEEGRGHTAAQSKAAFERHRLKGECERRFGEVPGDLGLPATASVPTTDGIASGHWPTISSERSSYWYCQRGIWPGVRAR